MKYYELRQKQQKEINDFPMFFAFSNKQFEEGIEKFNAKPDDLLSIPGGGFIRKTDGERFFDLFLQHSEEMNKAMENDEFLVDAIRYELANHEYCITYDPTDTLECLCLDLNDNRTKDCFLKAKEEYLNSCE